jgi:hypothetical protein
MFAGGTGHSGALTARGGLLAGAAAAAAAGLGGDASWPQAHTAPDPAPAEAGRLGGSAPLVGPDVLWEWVERMVSFGPRLPGSSAHLRYIDDLDTRLRDLGLKVTRHPVPLARWLARHWALRIVDVRGATTVVPVAAYRPRSGATPAQGVTGPLVDVGAGTEQDYQAHPSVAGAVVLAEGRITRLSASVLTDLAIDVQPPAERARLASEDYTRVWLGLPPQPDLALARRHGAIAMIEILDLPAALAAGQYTPHQQIAAEVPTLHVDREQGARLRALLTAGPVCATLVLTAQHDTVDVDYLLARPPDDSSSGSGSGSGSESGSGSRPARGTVLVATHTDGQNALEENGGPALLALAERLRRAPSTSTIRAPRASNLMFLFSPAHMAADTGTVKTDAFLRARPGLLGSIRSALVAEHLGAMAWDDQAGAAPYGPRRRTEPAVVAVGNSDALRRLAVAEVRASGLGRVAVLPPYDGGLYGEGTFPYRLGLPTVAFVSGPSYLLQVAPGDHLDKLDRRLLHRHTALLAGLLDRLCTLG